MAKKLDLTKMRAGQTVYAIKSKAYRRERGYFIEKLVVNNAPVPPEYVDCFYGGVVSRHVLKRMVECGRIDRLGGNWIFATRNAAQREASRLCRGE